ncbi:MAG: type II secretion system F family protein [Selenomonadaceae bacterium]|nr:type II secretion system F family protein [Selenomonadaceae bacterium]
MIMIVATFVTAAAFLIALYFLQIRENKRNVVVKRMEFFSGNASVAKEELIDDSQPLQERLMGKVRAVASYWRRVHQNSDLDLKMQQADWPLLGSEFQVILVVVSAAVGFFALLLTFDWFMMLSGFVGALLAGMIYLKLHIANRQKAFLNQLGDTLVMVSNALRAGFSFMQAMELISKEMEPPIGAEFQKVINEINLGATVDTAMENMGKRMQSSDFDLVVTAVLIQRQVGGNLSQVLDTISDTINERIRMRREISALTAQGKLSGIIVGAIPIFIAWFVYSQNPQYFDPMLESPMGKGLLVLAVLLELAAIFIIRKIIDIDV